MCPGRPRLIVLSIPPWSVQTRLTPSSTKCSAALRPIPFPWPLAPRVCSKDDPAASQLYGHPSDLRPQVRYFHLVRLHVGEIAHHRRPDGAGGRDLVSARAVADEVEELLAERSIAVS